MSKLTDALELAKAGFKAKEIKEMLEEQTNEPDPKPAEEKDPDPQKETDPPAGDPQPDPAAGKEKDPPAGDPEPDYKKLYEESQAQLKKAQESNVRGNSADPNEKTLEEKAYEILGGFIGG